MVEEEKTEPKQEPKKTDVLGHVILSAPVFLFYHLGLLISPQAANGVDPITRVMGMLAGMSTTVYLLVMGGLTLVYVFWVRRLARRRRFRPRRFPLVILEAAVYAVIMAPLAGLLLRKLHILSAPLASMGLFDRMVASAGAGFYEELVFRLAAIGILVFVFEARKMKRWLAFLLAALIASLVFSGFHYVGAGSEAFAIESFTFRFVLGLMLSAVYIFRGFATAVYAHFLYDVYVMCVWMG
jgi:lysylphosphatidylglycerol synthetase-like protein (DUF2156 family)